MKSKFITCVLSVIAVTALAVGCGKTGTGSSNSNENSGIESSSVEESGSVSSSVEDSGSESSSIEDSSSAEDSGSESSSIEDSSSAEDSGSESSSIEDSSSAEDSSSESSTSEEEPPAQYTVTFDSDGGTSVEAQVVEEGDKLQKPADPEKASGDPKSVYKFIGWFNGDVIWDFNADVVTGDLTLTAKYEKIQLYTVTFDSDGGTLVAPQVVQDGYKLQKPADPEKEPSDSGVAYEFIGWYNGDVMWDFNADVVTGDLTLTAKYANVYTLTFKSSDGQTDIGTLQVTGNGNVTQERLDEIIDEVPTVMDGRYKGWANSVEGTEDVSDAILTNPVTENAVYYVIYEYKVNYAVNVFVANYNWELEGDLSSLPEKYKSFPIGGILAYIKDSTVSYVQGNEQFSDLIGNRKGYEGDKADLSDFFAKLNACYSVNDTKTTDLDAVHIQSDTQIDVYLDWNVEALGFAPEDVIYAASWLPMSQLGLMRDPETGIAGMGFVFDGTCPQQNLEARVLLKEGLTKTSYQGIMVKFSYKSTNQVRVSTPVAEQAPVIYSVSEENWRTCTYDVIHDNATDDVRSVRFCPQGAGRICTLIIESVTYIESGNKTYAPSDLLKVVTPSYGGGNSDENFNTNDKIALAEDANGTAVLRYTTTGIEREESYVHFGEWFRFGNINFDAYSSIKVKFKANKNVSWRNGRDADYTEEYEANQIHEVDLMAVDFFHGDISYTLNGSSANGLMVGLPLGIGETVELDIYSIEFVAKT